MVPGAYRGYRSLRRDPAAAYWACDPGSINLSRLARDPFTLNAELDRDAIRRAIRRHGIRNSHLLAIAPTGTISLLAGNISSGIEPVFAFHRRRQVLELDNTRKPYQLQDYAWRLWQRQRRPWRTTAPHPPALKRNAHDSPA